MPYHFRRVDLGTALSAPPHVRPQPVVVDANAFLKDCVANVRRPAVTALLGLAEAERIRLFATEQVHDEVARYLRTFARGEADAACTLWRTRYLPLVRWVAPFGTADHGRSTEASDRLARLARRDPDDVPTARLALLCAPCLLVTSDRDLLDHGFGDREWVTGLRAAGELSDLEGAAFISMQLVSAIAGTAGHAGAAATRAIGRSRLGLGLVLGLAVMGATDWRPGLETRARRYGRSASRALSATMRAVDWLETRRAITAKALDALTVAPDEEVRPDAVIGGLLARAARPVAARELSYELARRRYALSNSELRVLLREHPAFVAVRGRGWELGQVHAPA